MSRIEKETATRIIDALALRIDKKTASAKTFANTPSTEFDVYDNWQDSAYATRQDTTRTKALVLAYTIFSGGRISKEGIKMGSVWFRPDVWIIKAMIQKGYLKESTPPTHFELTETGWRFVADVVEGLNSPPEET
ncbi:hypothetical protein [Sinorhizobium meliloti]|uniref:hypothetical protein n=1 Tax=Rhizobium meliloti TaxID=382 RepID=UPI00299D6557|nr:hypothetical protein [Sinorhizobium meliloti]